MFILQYLRILKMKLKEKISIEELDGVQFQIRLVESNENDKAVLTHYLLLNNSHSKLLIR